MMREVPLSQGYVALVDDDDYEMVMARGPWHVWASKRTELRYAMHSDTPPLLMHRLIMAGSTSVDHVDRDGLNNTRANLRAASHRQNMGNKRTYRNNTSGFKGVYLKRPGRWAAQVARRHIGYFSTAEDAARAYDAAALAEFGPFARINFAREHIA